MEQLAYLPVITRARAEGRVRLTEPEAKAVLTHLGIAIPRGRHVATADEAGAVAQSWNSPVVLKLVSPDLPHKSDVGGVRVGVAPAEVPRAAAEMLAHVQQARPEARLHGWLVEEVLTGGVECVAGLMGRTVLGPAVMFGLGGLFVEVFDDVAFRVAPLDEADARAMIADVRAARLLAGYRGARPASLDALVEVLVHLGAAAAMGELLELEINPLLALPDRAVALDAAASLAQLERA